MSELRPEVYAFSKQMNNRLEENDHKDLIGWKSISTAEAIHHIGRNLSNLSTVEALYKKDQKVEYLESIIEEAADIGNYAMMIVDNLVKEADE